MSGLSVKLPLSIDDVDGAYALNKNYKDLVKQNLRCVLLTDPGERIMDMSFGVGLKHKLFEQNTPVTREDIKNEIAAQIGKYLPYLEIEDIIIEEIADGNGISVHISYEIVPLSVSDFISVAFSENVA